MKNQKLVTPHIKRLNNSIPNAKDRSFYIECPNCKAIYKTANSYKELQILNFVTCKKCTCSINLEIENQHPS